jgi:hypothetical protein
MASRPALLLLVAGTAACGGRTELHAGPCAAALPIPCVAPGDDPCGPLRLVASSCDVASGAYACPSGAWPYARAVDAPPPCLPFAAPGGPVLSVTGSLVGVPTDDGRCLWVSDQVTTSDGQTHANVAFAPDRTEPFGTCPEAASFADGTSDSTVTVEGGPDPDILVQIASAFRFGGRTRVAYRLFRLDADAVFGVTLLGGGLGTWDAATARIVVPGASDLLFSPELDLGDASLVIAPFAFVWGCPTQDGFAHDCQVARFDAQGTMALFTGGGTWAASPPAQAGATVFQGGPWISSVVPDPTSGGLLHVWEDGFGTTLESQLSTAPEGPWSAGPTLGACDLPASDTSSYCAGPVVHPERSDPRSPGETVVSYGVGTTAAAGTGAAPADYTSRLQWATAP